MIVPRDTVSDTPVPDTLSETWDLSIGLSKQAAAARLGVATKTLERRAPEWGIRSAPYRRPGGGAVIVVYHPGDVDRAVAYVKRTTVAGIPVDVPDLPTNGNGHAPSQALDRPSIAPPPRLATLPPDEHVLRVVVVTETPPLSQTLSQTARPDLEFLTPEEAAPELRLWPAYVRRRVRELVATKVIPKVRGDRIQRRCLELI